MAIRIDQFTIRLDPPIPVKSQVELPHLARLFLSDIDRPELAEREKCDQIDRDRGHDAQAKRTRRLHHEWHEPGDRRYHGEQAQHDDPTQADIGRPHLKARGVKEQYRRTGQITIGQPVAEQQRKALGVRKFLALVFGERNVESVGGKESDDQNPEDGTQCVTNEVELPPSAAAGLLFFAARFLLAIFGVCHEFSRSLLSA